MIKPDSEANLKFHRDWVMYAVNIGLIKLKLLFKYLLDGRAPNLKT